MSSIHDQLAALNDAHAILNTAAASIAKYAADKPYLFIDHARRHIAKQADQLILPVFAEEAGAK